MNGLAVGPNELKFNRFILSRRGRFVVNTPASLRSLSCEIGVLDVRVQSFANIWNLCPKIVSKEINIDLKAPRLAKMSNGSTFLAEKTYKDSLWRP